MSESHLRSLTEQPGLFTNWPSLHRSSCELSLVILFYPHAVTWDHVSLGEVNKRVRGGFNSDGVREEASGAPHNLAAVLTEGNECAADVFP